MKNKKKLKKESFMGGVLVLMISHILIKILGLIYRVYLTNKQGFGDTGNAIYSSALLTLPLNFPLDMFLFLIAFANPVIKSIK